MASTNSKYRSIRQAFWLHLLIISAAIIAVLIMMTGWQIRSINESASAHALEITQQLQTIFQQNSASNIDADYQRPALIYLEKAALLHKANLYVLMTDFDRNVLVEFGNGAQVFGQEYRDTLIDRTGAERGTISVTVDSRVAINMALGIALLGAAVVLIALGLASKRYLAIKRLHRESVATMVETLDLLISENRVSPLSMDGPTELLPLKHAMNRFAKDLSQAWRSLDEQIASNAQEVSQTLEAIEIKNIELDLARKRAEESNEAKSTFLANISHEIRTPMNGIIGHLQLLQQLPNDSQQTAYIENSLAAANGLLDIIDDTLNLSRIEANRLDIQTLPFNLLEEVNRSVVMLAPAAIRKSLDVYFLCDPQVPRFLLGDSLRVRQVMNNLISNAIKYTERGSIHISVSASELTAGKHEIRLSVKDTGLGMDSGQMDSLFEAFSQAGRSPESGTGLGLLITRSLTEKMGGKLELVSTVGEGSTFIVTLMLRQHGNQSAILPRDHGIPGQVSCDDDQAREAFQSLLNFNGINTAAPESQKLQAQTVVTVFDQAKMQSLRDEKNDIVALCKEWVTPHILLLSTDDFALLNTINALPHCHALPIYCSASALNTALQRAVTSKPASSNSDFIAPVVTSSMQSRATLEDVRILLADDDHFGLTYMQELLVKQGAKVTCCTDGMQAIEAAEKDSFDLVLLDVRMPDCDGIEATQRLRQFTNLQHVPIIGMTASVTPEEHQLAIRAGMTDFWVKPLKISQLLNGLRHWLSQDQELVDDHAKNELTEKDQLAVSALDTQMRKLLRKEARRYLHNIEVNDPGHANFNANNLLETAHAISGTAAICGLDALQSTASEIQESCREKLGVEVIAPLVSLMRLQISQLLDELDHLERSAEPDSAA